MTENAACRYREWAGQISCCSFPISFIWSFDLCTVESVRYCLLLLAIVYCRWAYFFSSSHTFIYPHPFILYRFICVYSKANMHLKLFCSFSRHTPTRWRMPVKYNDKRNLICTFEIANSKINFEDFIRIIYMWHKLFSASVGVFTEIMIRAH